MQQHSLALAEGIFRHFQAKLDAVVARKAGGGWIGPLGNCCMVETSTVIAASCWGPSSTSEGVLPLAPTTPCRARLFRRPSALFLQRTLCQQDCGRRGATGQDHGTARAGIV